MRSWDRVFDDIAKGFTAFDDLVKGFHVTVLALLEKAISLAKWRYTMEIKNKHYIIGLLIIGFIVRVLSFQSGFIFTNDVNIFQWWGQMLHEHGLGQIYHMDIFIDYPPGYLYVLWVFGALASRFGWERLSTIFNFVSFMPAILADLGIGYIIYRMVAYGRLSRVPAGDSAESDTDEDPAKDRAGENARRRAAKPADLSTKVTIRALIMSSIWLLNPAVILISSVWGQIESVFTIFLLVSLLLLREKKIIASYILFGLAILIKAQSLFLGPVYLFSAIAYLRDSRIPAASGKHKIPTKAIERLVIAILSAGAIMIVLMLPFAQGVNILPVVRLYTGGLGTYPFASVNAFNFWGLMGRNWAPLETTFIGIPYAWWGILIVIALVAASFYALWRDYIKYEGRHFFFIVGALFSLIFIFSVRMHERYFFPAFAFFLLYYAETREKRSIGLYAAFSITFFFNCTEILRWLRHEADLSVIAASTPVISFFNVALGLIIIYMFVNAGWMAAAVAAPLSKKARRRAALEANKPGSKRAEAASHAKPLDEDVDDNIDKDTANKKGSRPASNSETGQASVSDNRPAGAKRNKGGKAAPPPQPEIIDPPPMKRRDYAYIFILIAVYSFIAFFRLGDFQAPQTSWTPQEGEVAIIDFGSTHLITEVQYRMGVTRPHQETFFTMLTSVDGVNWTHMYQFNPGFTSVFAWHEAHVHHEARFVQILAETPTRIQEVAFRGPNRELIPLSAGMISPGAEALVDEQHLVPEHRSFMNSTYFDEVYHPRAAYEYIHGLQVFENTHPPMGKNFIAMAVRVFGMTPFGWRFAGTLAGVLMVPLLYAFARLLFKSNNWGLFAALIFTFDFMHFAQTRIATIDSYVTLFIIAMYFFMYRFIHGVERDTLKQKLIILGLCGISVGLAAASKWQGVYAILGLPVVFFPALYRLYLKDRKQAETIFYSCFGFFIAIPLVIYILSYIPFASTMDTGLLRSTWDNQVSMYNYHSGLVEVHSFSSVWWEWPLILRPIWLYAGNIVDGARGSIASFGNPAVWWLGVVATLYIIFYFFTQLTPREFVAFLKQPAFLRNRRVIVTRGFDRDIAFLLVAFAAQYLPWMLITRLTWIYHFFPSVPFVVLIVTWLLKHVVERRPQLKGWVVGYACLVVALFALFYPVLSGLSVSMDFVRTYLQWLPRWHF